MVHQKLEQIIGKAPEANWYGWKIVQDHSSELNFVMSRRDMSALFTKLDADNDGQIHGSELRTLALSIGWNGWSEVKQQSAMLDIDANSDGLVSFEDVYNWYSTGGLARL